MVIKKHFMKSKSVAHLLFLIHLEQEWRSVAQRNIIQANSIDFPLNLRYIWQQLVLEIQRSKNISAIDYTSNSS